MTNVLFSALSARRGGGLTYIPNVVAAFPVDPCHRLSILAAEPIPGLAERDNVEWIRAPSWTVKPISRFLFGFLYFRFLWLRRRDFDVVYYAGGSFDISLPRGVSKVVAFRNMLPFDPEARRRYPLGWMRLRNWLLRYLQASAFRRADLVIFISDFARGVIDRLLPRRRGQSVVIPHGATATFAPLASETVERLPDPFVLYLSILDVYKAQVELVEAWARLREGVGRNEKLVLAGPENPTYAQEVRAAVSRLGLEREVVFLGPIPHDQVSDLARRAKLNVFLSACENCPNILLELMCAGTPLLVSARQPMPELGGPDLDYVDPYDVPAIAEALGRLLDDPQRLQHSAAVALRRSRCFDWTDAGRRTWAAILSQAPSGLLRGSARRGGSVMAPE